ncbi:MAG: hypothetical protein ACRD6W_07955 [Nitrososphaerales archaeon]
MPSRPGERGGRVRLLERHGGLWLDIDCIVLSPLEALLVPLEHDEVASWGAHFEGVSTTTS